MAKVDDFLAREDERDPVNVEAWATFNRYVPAETKDTLYHYTSLSGLMGIATSGTIWATDTSYLNDTTEAKYAHAVINEVQDAACRKLTNRVSDMINVTKQAWLLDTGDSHMYVASFSEVGDSLGQWVAYTAAGAGVAIGTKEYLLDPDSMVRQVMYDPKRQREFLRKIFKIYGAGLEGALKTRDKNRLGVLTRWLGIILHQALFCFKNPSFAAEREWRLMQLWPERGALQPQFRTTSRALVPYVAVPLQHPRAPRGILAITEVVLGPGLDFALNENAVRRLLAGRVRRLRVRPSCVPFRTLA